MLQVTRIIAYYPFHVITLMKAIEEKMLAGEDSGELKLEDDDGRKWTYMWWLKVQTVIIGMDPRNAKVPVHLGDRALNVCPVGCQEILDPSLLETTTTQELQKGGKVLKRTKKVRRGMS